MQGYFDPGKLTLYQFLLTGKLAFSESAYDFTRCVRPDGTAYGTGGTCRKGVKSDAVEKPKRGRPKKVRKPLAEMSPSERREEIERRVKETVRTLRKGDPEKLRQDWMTEHNKGRTPQEFPSGLRMAKDLAAKRVKEQAKRELGSKTSKKVEKEDAERKEREARAREDEGKARKAMREQMAPVKEKDEPDRRTSGLDPEIKSIDSLYKKLADLKGQNLPSGEMWRIDEVESEIQKVRKQALEKVSKLGEGKKAALDKIEEVTFNGFVKSRTQGEISRQIEQLQFDYLTVRGNPEEKETAKQLAKKLETLVENVSDPSKKAMYDSAVGRLTGRIKIGGPGSLKETQSAGARFLREYDEGLRSTTSIIRRANALEEKIRQRIELIKSGEDRNPGWIKRRLRLSTALMRLSKRRGDAEQRLEAKMKGIREEMLKTKLSDKEIFRLTHSVSISNPPGAKKSTPQEIAETRKHLEEFVRMFNGKGLTEIMAGESDFRSQLAYLNLNPSQRAHAITNTGFITTNGNKQTLFHEIGHIVEAQRPWLRDQAERWRNVRAFTLARAQADPETQKLVGGGSNAPVPYSLQKVASTGQETPVYKFKDMIALRDHGYKEDEIGFVNRYMSPYLGKIYNNGITEVISMTTEYFAEPHLMAYLYKRHPDLFALGVGLANT